MASSSRNAELQAQYDARKKNILALVQKLNDLESQSEEHAIVIRSLKSMEPDRKCFRMVGGVLVERTVGEVLPALEETHSGLRGLIDDLTAQYMKNGDDFRKWKKDNNIHIIN